MALDLCAYCLDAFGVTRDHVIPRAYRRTRETVPCCRRCNSIKHSRVFGTFEAARAYVRSRGRLPIVPVEKCRSLPASPTRLPEIRTNSDAELHSQVSSTTRVVTTFRGDQLASPRRMRFTSKVAGYPVWNGE